MSISDATATTIAFADRRSGPRLRAASIVWGGPVWGRLGAVISAAIAMVADRVEVRPVVLPVWAGGRVLREGSMNAFALSVKKFLVSEDGPTAVEYAVMLALIVIVCLAAIGTIGTNANTTFTNAGNALSGSSSP